jgi:hypothetical protein
MPALEPDGEMIAIDSVLGRWKRAGTARIAGIGRGTGLDEVGDLAALTDRQATLERADHAGGQRLIQTDRIADREGELADLQIR